MKMGGNDIGTRDKNVLRVLYPKGKPVDDPIAEAYCKVRDATCCADDVPAGMAIGILELVKAEILRDALVQLEERGRTQT